MFLNSYNRHNHDLDIDINVNRAPTDESIRLLNEFQEKAKDNIIKEIDIRDNEFPFNAACIVFDKNTFSHNYNFRIYFSLNGEKYTVSGSIPDYDLMAFNQYEVMQIVAEKISQQITLSLMDKIVKGL